MRTGFWDGIAIFLIFCLGPLSPIAQGQWLDCPLADIRSEQGKPQRQISFFVDNDNLFLGGWSWISPRTDGDDFGWTFGLGVRAESELSKTMRMRFEASTNLFTDYVRVNSGKGVQSSYDGDFSDFRSFWKNRYPVYYIDQRTAQITLKTRINDQFYASGGIGVEQRISDYDPNHWSQVQGAAAIQNGWHTLFRMYTMEYVPAEGGTVIRDFGANGNTPGDLPSPSAPAGTRIEIRAEPHAELSKVPQIMVRYTAGIGAEKQVWCGRCWLRAETGISGNSLGVLGYVNGSVSGAVSRFRGDFFVSLTSNGNRTTGIMGLGMESEHNIKGTRIVPFTTFTVPLLRAHGDIPFQDMNTIQRLGFRVRF